MGNVVFFDGVCNLCNKFVDFVIRHDKSQKIVFAPLQGNLAKEKLGKLITEVDSVIFYSNGKIYQKSTAAIRIMGSMGIFWKLCFVFLIIPPFIRNYIYDWIAQNRYQWFGKKETCRIPTIAERKRFLE